MLFVARQLLEKTREHHDTMFTLFVDLRKAYDSVPREALWKVLERCGVPPRMLCVVKSLHVHCKNGVLKTRGKTTYFSVFATH